MSQTAVIEGWKAEDAAYASYCNNRDMGISATALHRFYRTAEDFERRYADERRPGVLTVPLWWKCDDCDYEFRPQDDENYSCRCHECGSRNTNPMEKAA